MNFAGRGREQHHEENRLIPVVRPFDYRTRQALYAAANGVALRRRNWSGCALDRAAVALGLCVQNEATAAEVFQLPVEDVVRFIRAWDRLRGSDEHCTALLRDAILAVGLFEPGPLPELEVDARPAGLASSRSDTVPSVLPAGF